MECLNQNRRPSMVVCQACGAFVSHWVRRRARIMKCRYALVRQSICISHSLVLECLWSLGQGVLRSLPILPLDVCMQRTQFGASSSFCSGIGHAQFHLYLRLNLRAHFVC